MTTIPADFTSIDLTNAERLSLATPLPVGTIVITRTLQRYKIVKRDGLSNYGIPTYIALPEDARDAEDLVYIEQVEIKEAYAA